MEVEIIKLTVENDNLQTFWNLRDEYMVRDIFEYDELGNELTEEDKEWFLSSEYRNHMHKLFKKIIDTAFPILFIEDDEIIGFCLYCTYLSEDGKCFIVDFCILPEYREKGKGTLCFQLLKNAEIKRGAKYFELNCSNRRNKRFWEMQGFKLNGVDEHGTPLMVMYCDNNYVND